MAWHVTNLCEPMFCIRAINFSVAQMFWMIVYEWFTANLDILNKIECFHWISSKRRKCKFDVNKPLWKWYQFFMEEANDFRARCKKQNLYLILQKLKKAILRYCYLLLFGTELSNSDSLLLFLKWMSLLSCNFGQCT